MFWEIKSILIQISKLNFLIQISKLNFPIQIKHYSKEYLLFPQIFPIWKDCTICKVFYP